MADSNSTRSSRREHAKQIIRKFLSLRPLLRPSLSSPLRAALKAADAVSTDGARRKDRRHRLSQLFTRRKRGSDEASLLGSFDNAPTEVSVVSLTLPIGQSTETETVTQTPSTDPATSTTATSSTWQPTSVITTSSRNISNQSSSHSESGGVDANGRSRTPYQLRLQRSRGFQKEAAEALQHVGHTTEAESSDESARTVAWERVMHMRRELRSNGRSVSENVLFKPSLAQQDEPGLQAVDGQALLEVKPSYAEIAIKRDEEGQDNVEEDQIVMEHEKEAEKEIKPCHVAEPSTTSLSPPQPALLRVQVPDQEEMRRELAALDFANHSAQISAYPERQRRLSYQRAKAAMAGWNEQSLRGEENRCCFMAEV